jgi:hypothetical protein
LGAVFKKLKGKTMTLLFIQKLKFLALIGATAALVACGGGGSSGAAQTTNGNVTGNVSAANVAALQGSTFTFPNGLPDLGTTASTTVTFGGTAAAPTATIASGSTSVVADVAFGSCIFTFRTVAFGRSGGFTFTYPICTFNFRTNSLPVSFTPQLVPTTFTLNSFVSTPTNINTVILSGGQLTVNGNTVGGGVLTPVTGATGGGS